MAGSVIEMPTDDEPVKVIQGDCLHHVGDLLEVADALVSDPPYGMDWDTDTTRFSGGHNPARRRVGRNDQSPIHGDDREFDPSPWLDFPKVVLFGANHFWHRLPPGSAFVWIKRNDPAFGSFLSDAELAWVKGGCGVYCHRDLSMNAEALNRVHPCQKPVGLMRWCIRRLNLPPGSLIVDPYAGSGTTGLAAMKEGHKCILIEENPAYVDIIRKRLSEKGTLFTEASHAG